MRTSGKCNNSYDPNSDIKENSALNRSLSEDDILQAIKCLKKHKSCGNDLILNKFKCILQAI